MCRERKGIVFQLPRVVYALYSPHIYSCHRSLIPVNIVEGLQQYRCDSEHYCTLKYERTYTARDPCTSERTPRGARRRTMRCQKWFQPKNGICAATVFMFFMGLCPNANRFFFFCRNPVETLQSLNSFRTSQVLFMHALYAKVEVWAFL